MSRKNIAARLADVASAINVPLMAGSTGKGEITIDDDLEVEVTITVRRRVARHDRAQLAEQALAALRTDGWQDRCACSVPNRSPFRSPTNRTTGCSKPVVAAVATLALTGSVFFSFRCSVHRENHGRDARSVVAVLELNANALKVIRGQRKREREIREAEERAEREAARRDPTTGELRL